MSDILAYIYNQYGSKPYKFTKEELENLEDFFKENVYNNKYPEFTELYHYMLDYQPEKYTMEEWTAKSNWGIVNRNGKEYLVIIDDGFDENIFNQYYKY